MEILDIDEDSHTYLIRIEDSLDILILYYMMENEQGNIILKIGWQDKREERKGYKRLDRIHANVKIKPLKIYMDENLEGLRVTGLVLDSDYKELIGKKLGGDLRIGDIIKVETHEDLKRIEEKREEKLGIGVIIIDLTGYIVAEVSDKISILAEKYYPYEEITKDEFYKELQELNMLINRMKEKGLVIVAGVNIGSKSILRKLQNIDHIIYGDFSPDVSGISSLLKHEKLRTLSNKYIRTLTLYDEIINRERFKKIIYGINEVYKNIEYGLIYRVLVTKSTILKNPSLINKLYEIFLSCIEVDIINDDTSLGMYLNYLGGIAAFKY